MEEPYKDTAIFETDGKGEYIAYVKCWNSTVISEYLKIVSTVFSELNEIIVEFWLHSGQLAT
ncbi:hypothetical protein [Pleionea sediminis]|uniref:hypothetical protein n=1 Tax=Pleionea sediminis TaxID=2569479 RepID=UPI0011856E7A|nr:hypothetical protein [Pleionea sediminis]